MMSFSFSTSLSSTFPSVVLTIALFFALLFTTTTTTTTTAETITVDNWYIPPYNGPKTLDAKVGDTIVFEWNTVPSTAHNVFIHPTMDCELDGAFIVGDVSPTSYTFGPTDAGTDMFFACNIGSHCNYGKYNCTNAIVKL
jgi:plastocyanin